MRERLIELLREEISIGDYNFKLTDRCSDIAIETLADYLLENGVILVDTNTVDFVKNRKPIQTALNMTLDELSDLIRAKQDGRIITPPCKVGDAVYYQWGGPIRKGIIEEIDVYRSGVYFRRSRKSTRQGQ